MSDTAEALAADVAAVQRISAVPSLLKIICGHTGMGFAAVARVTDETWTLCAVEDSLGFGLPLGGQLELKTTLCHESRQARAPIVINEASTDPQYCGHHTPRIYKIESYISVPIVHEDGRYFGNLCAIDPRPAQLKDGKTVAMFESFAELIAHQLATESLRKEAEDALRDERALANLREQFIVILGHDLRNPLGAISNTAEILTLKSTDPAIVSLGERLRSTSRRMAGLVNDLLDFARGRLGRDMTLDRSAAADLAAALRDVVEEARAAHPERRIVDEVTLPGSVGVDRVRIQQVLSNLLGNAIAHGAADRPITVRASREQDRLEISVNNHGKPIPPQDLAHVFDPYWQAASHGLVGGLGLGLHICSEIVKAHGGVMEVASTPDAGTTFTARIPLSPDNKEKP